jgi:hypothetical protein
MFDVQRSVPMRVAGTRLFAARLGEILRIVFGANGDANRFAGNAQTRDVDLKGGVAAFVVGGDLPVDPHGGAVIDGAEVKHQPLAAGDGHAVDGSAIPARGVERAVMNAAGLGFG